MEETVESVPDLPGRLNNLGIMLERRFERTGMMEDLEDSIRRAQQAVTITPQDHLSLAMYLNNLGNKLETQFERRLKEGGLGRVNSQCSRQVTSHLKIIRIWQCI